MIIKEIKLIPYRLDLFCKCGGKYNFDGESPDYQTPTDYYYECSACERFYISKEKYPEIIYKEE